MSQFISIGILAGLALWGYGCHVACEAYARRASLTDDHTDRRVFVVATSVSDFYAGAQIVAPAGDK